MSTLAETLLAAVNPERIQERLFAMVQIPSPTKNARAMAEYYAGLLRKMGVAATLKPLAGFPDSPSVWGRWEGMGCGPTLQMAGHLDTIHTPHVAPYIEGGRIYGRGAADMKSGLAAIAEVIQVLSDHDTHLPGSLLITAYDMHEYPVGEGEGCKDLIAAGIFGDAVLVAEGPEDEVAIAGKGTTIFDIELRSPAGSPHELHTRPEQTNPLHVATTLMSRLIAWGEELKRQPIELLGTETLFLSLLHGGDFFNRLPGNVHIGGTRRFAPGQIERVRRELQELADAAIAGTELSASVTLQPMREGFRQTPDAQIIEAVRLAHQRLTGQEMRLAGQFFGADNEYFVNRARIPAVCMGAGLGASHADLEFVEVAGVVRLAKKMLLTALIYHDMA